MCFCEILLSLTTRNQTHPLGITNRYFFHSSLSSPTNHRMASSASSPSKPDDECILNELVSELHALKKLYGLLQNNSAAPVRPDQPTVHALDEKSRHLLRKLLDGATQQALQSQAKIISGAPEMPKSTTAPNPSNFFNDDLKKQTGRLGQPIRATENSQEEAKSASAAKSERTPNPCPKSEPIRNSQNRSEASKKDIRHERSVKSGGSKAGELLALDPDQKQVLDDGELNHQKRNGRKQVEAELISIRSKNRSSRSMALVADKMAQIVQKNDQLAERKTQAGSGKYVKPARVSGSKAKRISAPSSKEVKPVRLNGSKAKRISTSSSSSSSKESTFDAQMHDRMKMKKKIGLLLPQPTLSNSIAQKLPSLGSPKSLIVGKTDQCTMTKSRANKPMKSSQPNRSRERRYSSSSTCSTRSNSVSNSSARPDLFTPRKQSKVKTRERRRKSSPRASQKHIIPYHPAEHQSKLPRNWPTRTRMELKPDEEKDKQGRFKKLTNKLAIIFHHHHHHHHHLHPKEGKQSGNCGRKDHERSLWKYLKGFLHTKKGSGEVHGKMHSYNLRGLMAWFFRHLWWMSQRKRKNVLRPRVTKKVKWWNWFRRKGGVVVGGQRRIRLRLGINGSRRRAGRGNA